MTLQGPGPPDKEVRDETVPGDGEAKTNRQGFKLAAVLEALSKASSGRSKGPRP